MITIKRGLNLPLVGSPEQQIHHGARISTVALLGIDTVGLKPTMKVSVGDKVKTGQVLYTDKKHPEICYTSPANGEISAIHRGLKRSFQSVEISLTEDDNEPNNKITFDKYSTNELTELSSATVRKHLLKTGVWTAFRTRPYSKVPIPDSTPAAIFVTAMDTHPLAPNPEVIIAHEKDSFIAALVLLKKLTDGKLYVCKAPGSIIPSTTDTCVEEFGGPHPAGLTGTHIHFLDPVNINKTVWSIGYQDTIALGKLFLTGNICTERIISLSGPQVQKPRLIRTRIGASLQELTAGELKESDKKATINNRVICGSVFGGYTSSGACAFLSRYANQITVLKEGHERTLLHYLSPGKNKFSIMPIYISHFFKKMFAFTTSTNGSPRAMVPIGSYEKIMPLDILPTQLLRSLIVEDCEEAQKLGALELDEEDLSLCTFVCPGKYEYGSILRQNLTNIESEG